MEKFVLPSKEQRRGWIRVELIVEIEEERVKLLVRGAYGAICLEMNKKLLEALFDVENRSLNPTFYSSGIPRSLLNLTHQKKR